MKLLLRTVRKGFVDEETVSLHEPEEQTHRVGLPVGGSRGPMGGAPRLPLSVRRACRGVLGYCQRVTVVDSAQ